MNPRPPPVPSRRRFALNPQLREDLARFLQDEPGRSRALRLALLAGAVLLLTWPVDSVLDLDHGSFTYPGVGIVILVITAYLGLIHGIRYRAGGGAYRVQEWAAFVPISPNRYLLGTLGGRMADLLLFLLLSVPLLVPAAALEGAGSRQIAEGTAVLLVTAVTARLAALTLQLYLEHRPALNIVAAHAVLVGIFVLGEILWPPLSPLAAFRASALGGTHGLADWLAAPWPGLLTTHGLGAVALYGLCYLRVRGLRARDELPSGEPV